MAPSAIDEPKQTRREEKTYPPAKIFPAKETRFEQYLEPQSDGYKRALEAPEGGAAIVIDNGKVRSLGDGGDELSRKIRLS